MRGQVTGDREQVNLSLTVPCHLSPVTWYFRDVAQPGSALAWGARGRQFKSGRPDQYREQVIGDKDEAAGGREGSILSATVTCSL